MSSKYYRLQIDVSRIDKKELFQGKKGNYLNCFAIINDEKDQYGQVGLVSQSVSQEDRKKGKKGAILGNFKPIDKIEKDDFPF